MRLDRLLRGGEFAELEEVDDPPVEALQLGLAISRRPGRRDELVRDREALRRRGDGLQSAT